MQNPSRRSFLSTAVGLGAAASMASPFKAFAAAKPGSKMKFGLVTYLWGQHWDLPTLIANCEASKVLGVELRTTHKHGVEPNLTAEQRKEVKKRFDDSPVVHVGIGSNESFDAMLHARDPGSGIRDFEAVNALARGAGFTLKADVDMPANNRTLVWRMENP